MTYKFKFGFADGWLNSKVQIRSLEKAHRNRQKKHQVLYIYNDDELWKIVPVNEDVYKELWNKLAAHYSHYVDFEDTDNYGYGIYYLITDCIPDKLRNQAWRFLEQEYLKYAFNNHQATAIPDTTGTVNVEGGN